MTEVPQNRKVEIAVIGLTADNRPAPVEGIKIGSRDETVVTVERLSDTRYAYVPTAGAPVGATTTIDATADALIGPGSVTVIGTDTVVIGEPLPGPDDAVKLAIKVV